MISDNITVANIKADRAIIGLPGFEYIGRENISLGLKSSPLRNRFILGTHGDRNRVCDLYFEEILNPALDGEEDFADVLSELKRLAQRVANGDRLVLGCYCAPARCHGFDVAAAVRALAEDMKPMVQEKPAPYSELPYPVGRRVRLRMVPTAVYRVLAVTPGVPTGERDYHAKPQYSESQHWYELQPIGRDGIAYWWHTQLEEFAV